MPDPFAAAHAKLPTCMKPAEFRAVVQRHHPRMPRYVVLPASAARGLGLEGRVTVDGELNGVAFVRRSVKPWGDGRFFVDLPQSLCARAGVDTGDTVEMVLVPVSDDPPDDLLAAVTADPSALRSWEQLSPSQRRAIVNDVMSAVRAETRRRRVELWASRLASQT
jgi:Bacteriocin-protection, YdeI or OmpD-Associated/Domain of unknown function (DUF1905)